MATLGYFVDTLPILEKEYKYAKDFSEHFANCASLLQTIYIQQDFIEELLIVFKTKNTKGDLKKDDDYFINRDIRNELIGHPLRKDTGNKFQEAMNNSDSSLVSMSLFSLNSFNSISYLKYHIEKNFEFQHEQHLFEDVIKRHESFLDRYLNKVLSRVNIILERFIKHLNNFEKGISKMPMQGLTDNLSNSYSSIYQQDHLYSKDNLLKLDQNKQIHKRYELVLGKFYKDLSDMITDYKIDTYRHLGKKEEANKLSNQQIQEPILDNYYAIGKLFSLEDKKLFDMYSSELRTSKNQEILEELKYAKDNFEDRFEYYCTLHHIEIMLMNEQQSE